MPPPPPPTPPPCSVPSTRTSRLVLFSAKTRNSKWWGFQVSFHQHKGVHRQVAVCCMASCERPSAALPPVPQCGAAPCGSLCRPARSYRPLWWACWVCCAGTSLRYKPGVIICGSGLVHDCGSSRGIGYFLEALVLLALFAKKVSRWTLLQTLSASCTQRT